MQTSEPEQPHAAVSGVRRPAPVVCAAGGVVGLLGGLMELGGAEFRLPLLIGLFGFAALQAVSLSPGVAPVRR